MIDFDPTPFYQQADHIFKDCPALQAFPCGRWGCPWLEAQRQHHSRLPEGLLLMQDWGLGGQEDSLELTIQTLKNLLASGDARGGEYDQTEKRLFSPQRNWSRQIQAGEWWISNAVWGLRKSGGKSGCLPDAIHKAAFPLWFGVVQHLARDKSDFQLVVAGEWARFDRPRAQQENLSAYLQEWVQWATPKENRHSTDYHASMAKAEACKGRVWYVNHPSVWSYQNIQESPPATSRNRITQNS